MASSCSSDDEIVEDDYEDSCISDSFSEDHKYIKRLSKRFSEYRNNSQLSSNDDSESEGIVSSSSSSEESNGIVQSSPKDSSTPLVKKNNVSDLVIISSDEEEEAAAHLQSIPNLKQERVSPKYPTAKPQSILDAKEVSTVTELVTAMEHQRHLEAVRELSQQLQKTTEALRMVNINSLPDKGKLLRDKKNTLMQLFKTAEKRLQNMEIIKGSETQPQHLAVRAWEDIQAGLGNVQPKTFGKKGIATYNEQKEMTLECLQSFHYSLENGPKENDFETDPKGLKVQLMEHQRSALKWLLWREKQKPSGGILADDMGLGKTLTMIALVIKTNELNESLDSNSDDDIERVGKEEMKSKKSKGKYQGGTLVVCPASLLQQWINEIETRCKRGLLSIELYHGSKRENRPKRLAQYDIVITTYSIIQNEYDSKEFQHGAIFHVKFKRIILDEAHQIRNHKSQTSEAVCSLKSVSKWALTGTPVHNKELDFYALLKFLKCSPFDELTVWKRWLNDKSVGGGERLNTIISSIMLRRTKVELMEKQKLTRLPDRKWDLIEICLDEMETTLYQKVLLFSRNLFAQFLHQRAEKKSENLDLNLTKSNAAPNAEYMKMREKLLHLNNVKEVSQHHILVLLLRLRQICCHPNLITAMLDDCDDLDNDTNDLNEINLLEQLEKLDLNDSHGNNIVKDSNNEEERIDLKAASKGYLNPANPIFSEHHQSSKIKKCIEIVQEKVVNTNDKVIIVSQWKKFLDLVAIHLKNDNIPFDMLCGNVPVPKRMQVIEKINNSKDKTKVLLLSLTAGGVGLNLVGANHLILLDLHWNPQLENQAQDRIYRMGQNKPVFIYKLMVNDTIEQRIQKLQQQKLEIANSVLTGSKRVVENKLSLDDLKMLFGF